MYAALLVIISRRAHWHDAGYSTFISYLKASPWSGKVRLNG